MSEKKTKTGVYHTKKKNGSDSYRVSITVRSKHISLGSFDNPDTAALCYKEGRTIVESSDPAVLSYDTFSAIPYGKFISLLNLVTNGIYFATPIFLKKNYFEYHLAPDKVLKFDRDDLFFYASHKIQERGGYLFVADYGSQYKILKRYGIRPFAVAGRDFIQINKDPYDYRYANIKVLNNYVGVRVSYSDEAATIPEHYTAVIHIHGDFIIGRYETEEEAAIAYNKAVDLLASQGVTKAFIKNYIESLSSAEYHRIYDALSVSDKIVSLPASVRSRVRTSVQSSS